MSFAHHFLNSLFRIFEKLFNRHVIVCDRPFDMITFYDLFLWLHLSRAVHYFRVSYNYFFTQSRWLKTWHKILSKCQPEKYPVTEFLYVIAQIASDAKLIIFSRYWYPSNIIVFVCLLWNPSMSFAVYIICLVWSYQYFHNTNIKGEYIQYFSTCSSRLHMFGKTPMF